MLSTNFSLKTFVHCHMHSLDIDEKIHLIGLGVICLHSDLAY